MSSCNSFSMKVRCKCVKVKMADVRIPVWNTSFPRRACSRRATGWARGSPPSRRRRWRTRAPTVERARRRPTPRRHTRCPTRACNADHVHGSICILHQINSSIADRNYSIFTRAENESFRTCSKTHLKNNSSNIYKLFGLWIRYSNTFKS